MGFPNIWNSIPRPNLTHLATYICVYMCARACVRACRCVCAWAHTHTYIYTYTQTHTHTHTHTGMGAHTHVCIHVCAYIQLIVSQFVDTSVSGAQMKNNPWVWYSPNIPPMIKMSNLNITKRGTLTTGLGTMIGRCSPDSQHGKPDHHPAIVGCSFFRYMTILA